jgi:hypothetical protein
MSIWIFGQFSLWNALDVAKVYGRVSSDGCLCSHSAGRCRAFLRGSMAREAHRNALFVTSAWRSGKHCDVGQGNGEVVTSYPLPFEGSGG